MLHYALLTWCLTVTTVQYKMWNPIESVIWQFGFGLAKCIPDIFYKKDNWHGTEDIVYNFWKVQHE